MDEMNSLPTFEDVSEIEKLLGEPVELVPEEELQQFIMSLFFQRKDEFDIKQQTIIPKSGKSMVVDFVSQQEMEEFIGDLFD